MRYIGSRPYNKRRFDCALSSYVSGQIFYLKPVVGWLWLALWWWWVGARPGVGRMG
jgi:hypothetical protein